MTFRPTHSFACLTALALCLTSAPPATAQAGGGAAWLLVVGGAGGEPQYRDAFHNLGARLAAAAVRRHGLPAANVYFLAEDSARTGVHPVRGRSTRAGLERALADIAARATMSDRLVIVLIGHGSHQSGVSRFSLPGPDVTAAELAVMLTPFAARTIAVVNTSSASGEWVKALSGRNRIVITATKSAMEGNATLFPRFFVDAVEGDGADADKDGALSLLEAYTFARREVARAFEGDNRLLTEHAQLDDDGDGRASPATEVRGMSDGALARRTLLRGSASATTATATDPRLATLYARRDSLQGAVESLRARKEAMGAAAYEQELERLLVDLATASRAIRAAETRSP